MMIRLRHQLIYWFPVYIYVFIIFYFSSLPNVFTYAPQVLKPAFMDVSNLFYHVIEYMVLGFLLYRALVNSNCKHSMSLTILIAILYGFTDEIHQLFVPSRVFSLLDILANSFGVVSSQSVLYIIKNLKIKKNLKFIKGLFI